MAVVVEISKTQHLAFSPLNEKHNLLYNKARHIFNQRFIQKPWFDLNPFLDEADKQNEDLENFAPDEYKRVQPLQSLCIVEDYFCDRPQLTKEFGIGEFWDFLFSNSWAEGYSIRVLEGRLHDIIVSTLVCLTHSGEVVQHSTLAYAKNKRPRTSVYKHTKASKYQNLGCAEETLLLEFLYYGHNLNRETDDSSIGYVGSSTTFPYASSVSEELESSDHECQDGQPSQKSTIKESFPDIHPPPDISKYSKVQQKRLRRRVHYTQHEQSVTEAKPSAIHQTLSRQTINRNLSRQTLRRTVSRIKDDVDGLPTIQESGPPSVPSGIPRKETLSNFSSGSDYKQAPPKIDLKKFMCTERVSYLGEFDLCSEGSSSESEDEEHYGQEFYLGDLKTSGKNESVETMLKRRKEIVAKLRSDWRKQINEYKPRKSILPELSALEVHKYLSDESLKKSSQKRMESEKVPDLDEFIQMMEEEERFDPTLGSPERQKYIRVARKYKLIKPENERFGDEVGGVTDSVSCKLHCYDQDPTWKTLRESTKRNYLLTKLMKAGGKVTIKPKKKRKKWRKKSDPVVIPLISVTTTTGITYIHPVSKAILQKQMQIKEQKKQAAAGGRTRTALLPSSPTALKQELDKKRKKSPTSSSVSSTKDGSLAAGTDTAEVAQFPKATLVTCEESPDTDTDEESDELSDSPFNTKKLNINYSIEKIRTKRAKKKKKTAKFRNVLQKYYRMQSIIKAFTPNPQLRRPSLPAYPSFYTPGMKAKRKPRKAGLASNEEEENVKEPITVGKLKRFNFLNARDKIKRPEETHTEEPLFGVYPMEDFRLNTERALEEFVVRREIVVSDMSSKASVSITFTKKSVFSKSKFSNV